MRQLRGDADLAKKPIRTAHRMDIRTHLDRHQPIVAHIARRIYSRHRASTQFAFNAVRLGDRGDDLSIHGLAARF